MQQQAFTHEEVLMLNKVRADLNAVYAQVPATKGCMEHINEPLDSGGCGARCCLIQNPQVLYSEYLNSWRHVNQEWDAESFLNLIAAAVRTYLNNSPTKGCIFWEKKTRLCTQHTTRPLACRTYGIMPEEEWKPKYERLKVVYPKGEFMPQCGLVSTENGQTVTRKDTDRWWRAAVEVEKSLGVPAHKITDAQTGTYRTYHDHIIMNLFGQNKQVIVELTRLRVNGTPAEKESFVQTLISEYRKRAAVAEAAKSVADDIKPEEAKPTEDGGDGGSGTGGVQDSEHPNTDSSDNKS